MDNSRLSGRAESLGQYVQTAQEAPQLVLRGYRGRRKDNEIATTMV